MRILHTSDWHLGQTFHNYEREWEHAQFLRWLLGQMEEQSCDALVVSGDVFDSANPSASSQRLLYGFFADAHSRRPHLRTVLIAGNHDSAGRLEAPAPLLGGLGVTVVGSVPRTPDGEIDLDRMIVPLSAADGHTQALCLAVPFLRAADLPRVESDGDAYIDGIRLLHRRLIDRALEKRRDRQPMIALGHCHMTGGRTSELSERRIVIGGAEALPSDIFDDNVAYAALGHLHLAQSVGSNPHIRYAGSPLPLSFAETHYQHQVVCVDVGDGAAVSIEEIPVPRFVQLLRVPETPAPPDEVYSALRRLDVPERSEPERPYLEVRLSLERPEPGLRDGIEAALHGKPVRLARIDVSYPGSQSASALADAPSYEDLSRLQPGDLFAEIYRRKYRDDPCADLMQALQEATAAAEMGRAH